MGYDYTVAINQGEAKQPVKRPTEGESRRGGPEDMKRKAVSDPSLVTPAAPVLGWLVRMDDNGRGWDFPLIKAETHIGGGMDIEPQTLGVTNAGLHLVITYEAAENGFYIRQEGGEAVTVQAPPGAPPARNAVQALTGRAPLRAYDAITAGSARLIWVPFCGGNRQW